MFIELHISHFRNSECCIGHKTKMAVSFYETTALQIQRGRDVGSLFLTIGMVIVVLNFRLMLFIHQKLMALLMPFLLHFLPFLFI
jgi:hypothetical protein